MKHGRSGFILLWLVLSVALWNGVLDLYVSRGAREYLQLQAEFQLGLRAEPAMAEVMRRAKRDGVRGASLWTALILAAGLTTTLAIGRFPRTVH
jgi:hypothetical protein